MQKSFLYHKAPSDMRGTILYPLNQLKDIYPDLYEEKVSKYKDREQVMERKIPFLDCLWNDVLHFTAVHPEDIKLALKEAGSDKKNDWRSFKINPYLLDPDKTIVWLYTSRDPRKGMLPENFVPFDPNNLSPYSIIPNSTKEYYKETISKNEIPLVYGDIAHIFYKGSLNISGSEIV